MRKKGKKEGGGRGLIMLDKSGVTRWDEVGERGGVIIIHYKLTKKFV